MKITISGPIGSGKSTVGHLIADRLGFRFFSGGYFFRKKASDLGMTVEEFNLYAEDHEGIDQDLDSMIVEFIKGNDDIVVESRLAAWMCHRNGITAFKVFLWASPGVRFQRITNREGNNPELREKMIQREESEWKRYMHYYGIDYSDTSIYDMVINTDNLLADQVAEMIYDRVREAEREIN